MKDSPDSTPQTIAADLRRQIDDGDLAPGARLPSETRLAEHYSARRAEVHTALSTLRAEGLITIKPRSGTYVRETAPLEVSWTAISDLDHHVQAWDGSSDQWESAVRAAGHTSTTVVDVELDSIPPPRAAELLESTGTAVKRHLIRFIDHRPAISEITWIPSDLAAGTIIEASGPVSAPGGVMRSVGIEQTDVEHFLTVRMPRYDETIELEIPDITPVLERWEVGRTTERAALARVSVFPGNRVLHRYQLRGSR